MRMLGSVLTLLLLAGCSRSISIELAAQPLTVVTYANGKADQRCTIAPASDKFHRLADFLKQNSADWRKRTEDYTPSLVVIGSDINMYFMNDLMVLNYPRGEYARTVDPQTYAFLRCGAR